MHRICFAPVLSATLSRDSCWIMVCLLLLRLLEDLHHAPALGRAEGAGLHDQDTISDAAVVLLVVGLELAGAAQHLAVQRVLDAVLGSVLAHAPTSSDSVVEPGAVRMPSSRSRTTV